MLLLALKDSFKAYSIVTLFGLFDIILVPLIPLLKASSIYNFHSVFSTVKDEFGYEHLTIKSTKNYGLMVDLGLY